MFSDLKNAYAGVFAIFGRYWKAYGGWRAVLFSPYLHAALLLTVALNHSWVAEPWWKTASSILPNMVGFAIGGYAIWLGFGDADFRKILTKKKDGGTSPYVVISASFAHFILIQLGALLLSIVADGLDFALDPKCGLGKILFQVFGSVAFVHEWLTPIGNFVGFLLFMYALTSALATSMAVFRLTTILERDD